MHDQTPIIRAAYMITALEREQAKEGLALLREEIARGADVNTGAYGASVLGIMLRHKQWHVVCEIGDSRFLRWEQDVRAAVKDLLRAGADPLLHKPNAWSNRDPWAQQLIFEQLHKMSHEKVLLSERGENPLHLLLSIPSTVTFVAERLPDEYVFKQKWINAQDHDGKTPLHHAWRAPYGELAWGALKMTDRLMRSGAHINIADNKGHTVAHLIAHCTFPPSPSVEQSELLHAFHLARATDAYQHLDRETLNAPVKRNARHRL